MKCTVNRIEEWLGTRINFAVVRTDLKTNPAVVQPLEYIMVQQKVEDQVIQHIGIRDQWVQSESTCFLPSLATTQWVHKVPIERLEQPWDPRKQKKEPVELGMPNQVWILQQTWHAARLFDLFVMFVTRKG